MAERIDDSLSNVLTWPKEPRPNPDDPLSPTGDGGGTSGGMDGRVAKLEADMQDVKIRLAGMDAKMATKDDIAALRADLAEMKGLMKAMPTTLQLLGFVVAIFVAAGLTKVFIPA